MGLNILLVVLAATLDGGATARVLTVGEPVVLQAGEAATMRMPDMKRVAVGDTDVLDVRVGFEWVDLEAKHAGKTTLMLWTKAGTKVATSVTVTRPPIAAETDLSIPSGVSQTLELGGATALDTVDHQVATAEIRLGSAIVRAHAPGETMVVVTNADGKTTRVPLSVTAPTSGALAGAPVISLELTPGATVVLTVDGAREAAASQPAIVKVEARTIGTFALTGATAGQTLLTFKVDGGTRQLLVRVAPR